jgi:hypothetical protein
VGECILWVREGVRLLSRILARNCEGTEVTLAVKIVEIHTRGAAQKTYSTNAEDSTAIPGYV